MQIPDHPLVRKALCAVLPRGLRLTRRLPDGTVVGGPNRAGHGGRGVFVYGADLEPELALLGELLEQGDAVVDVGANSGLYSLVAARIVGEKGVVVSMEPNPSMLAVLDRNVRANAYTNVRLRGLAASDAHGSFDFYEHKNMPNSFSIRSDSPDVVSFSILGIDIDTLLEWEGIDRLDLLKIDAEGVEDQVLAGAARTLAEHRPVIIAEVTKDGLSHAPDGYVMHTPARGSTNNTVLVPREHPRLSSMRAWGWITVE